MPIQHNLGDWDRLRAGAQHLYTWSGITESDPAGPLTSALSLQYICETMNTHPSAPNLCNCSHIPLHQLHPCDCTDTPIHVTVTTLCTCNCIPVPVCGVHTDA